MAEPNWWLLGPLIGLAPLVIIPVFWSFISLVIGNLGGWAGLARHYPLRGPIPKTGLTWQSMWIGLMNYRNCVNIAATDDGLYLATVVLFRIGHPPMFIPWAAIIDVVSRRVFLTTITEVRIATPSRPMKLQFPPALAKRLDLDYYMAHKPPPPLHDVH